MNNPLCQNGSHASLRNVTSRLNWLRVTWCLRSRHLGVTLTGHTYQDMNTTAHSRLTINDKRKQTEVFLISFIVYLLSAMPLCASSGTQGAAFLDIPVGGGPAAMGSAYTALATDAYAPTWNPGGLGFLDTPQFSGQHLSYLDSLGLGSIRQWTSANHRDPGCFVQCLTRYALGQQFRQWSVPGLDPEGSCEDQRDQ